MRKMQRSLSGKGGFTLVELMIVVIIVGILAAVAVPLFRQNVKKAMASEGAALVGTVRTSQRVFHVQHQTYCTNANQADLGVDTTGNKYFTSFTLTLVSATAFRATTVGTGDATGTSVRINEAGLLQVNFGSGWVAY